MESWVAFAALIVTIISSVIVGSWTLSAKISGNRAYYLQEVGKIRHETVEINNFRGVVDKIYREMNEPVFALREHVGKVELYLERDFLKKNDYTRDQDKLLLAIKDGQELCSRQFATLEAKIERLLLTEKGAKDVHS
jgi:hypothetical protein